MTPKARQGLIVGAFVLLAILAVAGWWRNPAGPVNGNALNGNAVYGPGQGAWNTAAAPGNGQPAYASPQPGYSQQSYSPAYAPQNCAEPLGVQSAAYAPYESRYRTYSRPRVVRYVEEESPREVVTERSRVVERSRRGRSTGKSVAIVGGSAGVGAAIGALAGGGKGAAIGAISGGTAGFVYDRLTHNR